MGEDFYYASVMAFEISHRYPLGHGYKYGCGYHILGFDWDLSFGVILGSWARLGIMNSLELCKQALVGLADHESWMKLQ